MISDSHSTQQFDLYLQDKLSHINNAIDFNDINELKNILNSIPPEILRDVLTYKNEQGNSVLHQAITLDKPEIVKEILLSTPPEILRDIIIQKDKDDFDSIYLATILNKAEIVKAILSSAPPEILRNVLTHKNKHGKSALHQAIESNKPEIVKAILSSTPSEILSFILQYKNKLNENLIIIAVKKIIDSEDLHEKEKSEEILKLIFKKQFNHDIDDEQKTIIVNYVKNHMLLNLMSLDTYSTSEKVVINILKEVVNSKAELQSNPISQIYRDEIKKILTKEPIDLADNKCLFICSADVFNHASYLAFCVDKTNNKLLSITYCDGNYYDELGDKKVSLLSQSLEFNRFYGVRSYEVRDDILFSDDFAKKFVEENFKGKDFYQFKFPFQIDGRDIRFGNITHSIDTQIQSRGNCAFKSLNLLARFLFEQTTRLDHHVYYKKFKNDLREHVIKGLGQDYQKIKEAFGQDFVDSLAIKENLQKFSETKFGRKKSETFDIALKGIQFNGSDDVSQGTGVKVGCFSCLAKRVSFKKSPILNIIK